MPRLLVAVVTIAVVCFATSTFASGQTLDPPEGVYAVFELGEYAETDALANLNGGPWWRIAEGPMSQFASVLTEPRLEAFVLWEVVPMRPESPWENSQSRWTIALRAPEAVDLSVELLVHPTEQESDADSAVRLSFELPAEAFSAEQRGAWLHTANRRDRQLLSERAAGGSFFRRRLKEREAELDVLRAERMAADPDTEIPPGDPLFRAEEPVDAEAPRPTDDVSMRASVNLMSGSRAISENLALDRRLPLSAPAANSIVLDTIQGVTVRPYDFEELLPAELPELDPLARLIPADQYAVFFPGTEAALAFSALIETDGTSFLSALGPTSVRADAKHKLELQLGLPSRTLTGLLGPAAIRSLALTGAGFELEGGSDLAVLVEPTSAPPLLALLRAQIGLTQGPHVSVEHTEGEIAGVRFDHFVTPDRRLNSFLAQLGEAIVICNSGAQLERLIEVSQGERVSLASLDEYVYYRDRYPRGAENESAFLMLSDPTIRRMCGPRARIGASRQLRARAALLDTQAGRLRELLDGTAPPSFAAPERHADLDELHVVDGALFSDTWGTAALGTPVIELDLDNVTEAEAVLYEEWRQGYERNWVAAFDPIAARLDLRDDIIDIDLSVLPLTVNTDYQEMRGYIGEATLSPWSGDPHADSLAHFSFAIDAKLQRQVQQSPAGMFVAMTPALDPFAWLGESVSFWVDDDPVLLEAREAEDPSNFWDRNFHRMPLALHAEVDNAFALAAFLTGVRTLVASSAPDMLLWETVEHEGVSFVRIRPGQELIGPTEDPDDPFAQLALHYVANANGLTVSLNRGVIERAIDRQLLRREAAAAAQATPEEVSQASAGGRPAWLGSHVGLSVELTEVLPLLDFQRAVPPTRWLRARSWSNLPILDALHRIAPADDALTLHERLSGERLVCPAGGVYRLNEVDGVYESSVFGHPGRPLSEELPPRFDYAGAAFGLSFEGDGLRARMRLHHER